MYATPDKLGNKYHTYYKYPDYKLTFEKRKSFTFIPTGLSQLVAPKRTPLCGNNILWNNYDITLRITTNFMRVCMYFPLTITKQVNNQHMKGYVPKLVTRVATHVHTHAHESYGRST